VYEDVEVGGEDEAEEEDEEEEEAELDDWFRRG
jgi:hypothetical protein